MSLETDNPDKGQLLKKSAHHRELLEKEVKLISDRSERIMTNALIIGGALLLAYLLASSLSGNTEKRKAKQKKIKLSEGEDATGTAFEDEYEPPSPGIVAHMGSVLVAQATGFLLSVARDKLIDFLQSQGIKKENSNEHS